ncbi:DUF5133 domain-containing protein [Streptomyces sp. I05A-00742]|uniref:DUF5133 domain-containing protein n=1 Tax=Streptomyces sp. I05A-00742 TaxID=2732853 RepID=UPI0014884A9A|nr:DUF5133 domain-containing protein [Streptomyces sp. I05A-00742]
MLMAHPAVLHNLVERYTALAAADPSDAPARRQVDDAAYTLCVTTGTRRIEDALAVAARVLGAEGGSLTPAA